MINFKLTEDKANFLSKILGTGEFKMNGEASAFLTQIRMELEKARNDYMMEQAKKVQPVVPKQKKRKTKKK